MALKYSFQEFDKEHMARAMLISVPIPLKSAVMVGRAIKGKNLQTAKNILEQVILKKTPIKFTKFNQEQAHRKAIGPGKFPVKTARYMLKLLKEVEANAQLAGLDTSSLKVFRVIPKEAPVNPHYGRIRGISMKRASVELIVVESVDKKKKDKKNRAKSKTNNKTNNKNQKSKVESKAKKE